MGLLGVLAVGVAQLVGKGSRSEQPRSGQGATGMEDGQTVPQPHKNRDLEEHPSQPLFIGKASRSVRMMSLVELIANPKTYDGVRVAVIGYVTLSYEDEAIYLHKDDYENRLFTNAVKLALTTEQMEQYQKQFRRPCYAEVEGIFHVPEADARVPFAGKLLPVSLLKPWFFAQLELPSRCD
jgi:hypothetical protein